MADLTTKKRNALPNGDFGLPGSRKYPMNDKAHAANAKARATAAYANRHLSKSALDQIKAKANRVLKGK